MREVQARALGQQVLADQGHTEVGAVLAAECSGQRVAEESGGIGPASHLAQEFEPLRLRVPVTVPVGPGPFPAVVEELRVLGLKGLDLAFDEDIEVGDEALDVLRNRPIHDSRSLGVVGVAVWLRTLRSPHVARRCRGDAGVGFHSAAVSSTGTPSRMRARSRHVATQRHRRHPRCSGPRPRDDRLVRDRPRAHHPVRARDRRLRGDPPRPGCSASGRPRFDDRPRPAHPLARSEVPVRVVRRDRRAARAELRLRHGPLPARRSGRFAAAHVGPDRRGAGHRRRCTGRDRAGLRGGGPARSGLRRAGHRGVLRDHPHPRIHA